MSNAMITRIEREFELDLRLTDAPVAAAVNAPGTDSHYNSCAYCV